MKTMSSIVREHIRGLSVGTMFNADDIMKQVGTDNYSAVSATLNRFSDLGVLRIAGKRKVPERRTKVYHYEVIDPDADVIVREKARNRSSYSKRPGWTRGHRDVPDLDQESPIEEIHATNSPRSVAERYSALAEQIIDLADEIARLEQTPDLSNVSTDYLLAEIRRRATREQQSH